MKRIRDWTFYYLNGNSCYHPDKESQVMADAVRAAHTVQALRWAADAGMFFEWSDDDQLAEVYTGETDAQGKDIYEELPAVVCALFRANEFNRECVASLCGITESDDSVERDNYRAIVEGELASEAFYEYVLGVQS